MLFHKYFLAVTLVIATAAVSLAGTDPGTCSTGSVHDMNTFAFVLNDPLQRVCAFCHVPHNAYTEAGTLWARPLDETASGLKPYTWVAPTNQDIPQKLDPLVGPSRLCMSCHDGSLALDAHGGTMPEDKVISKKLDITHPIGFSYDDAMQARGSAELVDKHQPFATELVISENPEVRDTVVRQGKRKIIDVLYMGSVVTCSTCHDVHNCNNVTPDSGHVYNYLLWAKEEHSLICMSCHIK